jgi:hypothetical protein
VDDDASQTLAASLMSFQTEYLSLSELRDCGVEVSALHIVVSILNNVLYYKSVRLSTSVDWHVTPFTLLALINGSDNSNSALSASMLCINLHQYWTRFCCLIGFSAYNCDALHFQKCVREAST